MVRPGLENIPLLSALPDIPYFYTSVPGFSFIVDAIALCALFGVLLAPLGVRVIGKTFGKRFGAILGIILGLSAAFALRTAGIRLFEYWFTTVASAAVLAIALYRMVDKLLGGKYRWITGAMAFLIAWLIMDTWFVATGTQRVRNIFGIMSFVSMLGPIIFIIFLIYAINKMPAKPAGAPAAGATTPAAPEKPGWARRAWRRAFGKGAPPPGTPAAAADAAQDLNALFEKSSKDLKEEFKKIVDAIKESQKAQQATAQVSATAEKVKDATAPEGTVRGDNIIKIADARNPIEVKLQELDAAIKEKLNALAALQKDVRSMRPRLVLEQAFESTIRDRLGNYGKIVLDAKEAERSAQRILTQINALQLRETLLTRYQDEIDQPFQTIKDAINNGLKPSLTRLQEFLNQHQKELGNLETLQRDIENTIADITQRFVMISSKPPAERDETFLNEMKQYGETLTTQTCPRIHSTADALNDAATALRKQDNTMQQELAHAAAQYADITKRSDTIAKAITALGATLQQAAEDEARKAKLADAPALEVVYTEINDIIAPWMTTIENVKSLQEELLDVENVFRKEKEGKKITEEEWQREINEVIEKAKGSLGQLKIDEKEIGEAIVALDKTIPIIELHKESTASQDERNKLGELQRHLTTFKEQIGDMKNTLINSEAAFAEAAFGIVKERLREQQTVKAATVFKNLDALLKPLNDGLKQLEIIKELITLKIGWSLPPPPG